METDEQMVAKTESLPSDLQALVLESVVSENLIPEEASHISRLIKLGESCDPKLDTDALNILKSELLNKKSDSIVVSVNTNKTLSL